VDIDISNIYTSSDSLCVGQDKLEKHCSKTGHRQHRQVSQKTLTSWRMRSSAVRLSRLENAYSRSLFPWAILTRKVGQTNLVFGTRSGFVRKSVNTR